MELRKVELFEQIRRDFYLLEKSIRQIARERQIHRREVRSAVADAVPPKRKQMERNAPVLTLLLRAVVDDILKTDRRAPRKQRHTARRIFARLKTEHGFCGAESTVRKYVGARRRELVEVRDAFVPLAHLPGDEGEVDWYEAVVEFPWGEETAQFFQMRACSSDREFHMAFPRQTQQAFLEGHVAAYSHLGGVFHRMRYDNLSAAVKRVLRGRRRDETVRFIALRSHYLFEGEFCLVGEEGAHEKGGVEGGVGRFRRTHLVPVPKPAGLKSKRSVTPNSLHGSYERSTTTGSGGPGRPESNERRCPRSGRWRPFPGTGSRGWTASESESWPSSTSYAPGQMSSSGATPELAKPDWQSACF